MEFAGPFPSGKGL